MKYTNHQNLSNAVRDAIIAFAEDYDKVGWKSVTTLCDSPRSQLLRERHSEDITEDVADLIWSFFGNMGHLIAERSAGTDAVCEQRFIQPVDGKDISFKPDRLEKNVGEMPVTWTLRDFKVTSVYVLKAALQGHVKIEWERQMNMYVYLLEQVGFVVSNIKLEVIARDWRLSEQRIQHDYPRTQAAVIDVPIWTREKQHAYLMERIKLFKEAEALADDDLPKCTEGERWADPDRWAVVKKTSKPSKSTGFKASMPRASRFKSHAEAEAFIAKVRKPKLPAKSKNPRPETIKKATEEAAAAADLLEVEFRKGESKRCERGYCKAAPWCSQFREDICPPF